ncbi:hypothetical protein RE428_17910 [Marinobacter nanhaiticus D15-8W]|nr:hypothetical protein RE428_17910 [Marinobacter nanhaiticus D15-8W]
MLSQGVLGGVNRIAKLKRQAGLVTALAKVWQRSCRGQTFEHIVERRLLRCFSAEAPNQRWVGDITFISTAEGWLYLSAFMDLFSRMIVGWSKMAALVETWLQRHWRWL